MGEDLSQLDLQIYQALPLPAIGLDANLRCIHTNAAFAKWIQKAENELPSHSIGEILGPSFEQLLHAQLAASPQEQGFQRNMDVEIPNGNPVHLQLTCLFPKQAAATKIILIINDQTVARTRALQLEESERRLNYALEVTGEGVWDWSLPRESVTYNKQWGRLMDIGETVLTHPLKIFAERIHPADYPDFMIKLQDTLTNGGSFYCEHRIQRKDGSQIWVSNSAKVVERDISGAATRMVGSCCDITAKREAQNRLTNTAKLAWIGKLATHTVHEINNALSIIVVKLDLIMDEAQRRFKNEEGDQKLVTDIKKVMDATNKITQTIKTLRSLARNDEKESVQIARASDLVKEAATLIARQYNPTKIDYKLEVEKDFFLPCRSAQIVQTLMNLIENSYEAIEGTEHPWVKIVIGTANGLGQIRITDSGKGIPPETAKKILIPFFTTKDTRQGTGLGLSIAQRFVEENDGHLRLDRSSPNTSFVLEFKIKARENSSPSENAA